VFAAKAARDKANYAQKQQQQPQPVQEEKIDTKKRIMSRIFGAKSSNANGGKGKGGKGKGVKVERAKNVKVKEANAEGKGHYPPPRRRLKDNRPMIFCTINLNALPRGFELSRKSRKRKNSESSQSSSNGRKRKREEEKAIMPPPQKHFFSYVERLKEREEVVNDNLDHYMKEAKQLKHEADRESDRQRQAMLYLRAVLLFSLCGNIQEQSNDRATAFTMYKETINLIKHVCKPFRNSDQGNFDTKLAVLK